MKRTAALAVAYLAVTITVVARGGDPSSGRLTLTEGQQSDCKRIVLEFVSPGIVEGSAEWSRLESEVHLGRPWHSEALGVTVPVSFLNDIMDVSLSRGYVSSVLYRDVAKSAPRCRRGEETPRGDTIPLTDAETSARRFLTLHSLNQQLASLAKTRGQLGCAAGGLCAAYEFSWREAYPASGVAMDSESIDVFVHPLSGEVVLFSRIDTTYSGAVSVSPEQCRRILAERFGELAGFRIVKLKLAGVFDSSNRLVPVWAVDYRYSSSSGEAQGAAVQTRGKRVIVDAELGEVFERSKGLFESRAERLKKGASRAPG